MLYPDIIRYQSGSTVARHVNRYFPGVPVDYWKGQSYSLEFYLRTPLQRYDSAGLRWAVANGPVLLLTAPEQADTLQQQGYSCQLVKEFVQFYVTRLDLRFVNHKTRASSLQRRWLLLVQPGRMALAE